MLPTNSNIQPVRSICQFIKLVPNPVILYRFRTETRCAGARATRVCKYALKFAAKETRDNSAQLLLVNLTGDYMTLSFSVAGPAGRNASDLLDGFLIKTLATEDAISNIRVFLITNGEDSLDEDILYGYWI